MPRGSFKPEDAMRQFGFQEGNIEVVKSVVAIHQFPVNTKTGEQSAPLTAMRFTVSRLDENWGVIEDAEQEVIVIRLGSVDDMRPGNLKDPANMDEEPSDLGREVDTEGNSLFLEDASKKTGTGWGLLVDSFVKHGFKSEVIGRSYAPDFEGMKCHLKSVAGTPYTDKKTGEEKKPYNILCDRIETFPYEKKGKKGSGAGGKVVGTVAATGKKVTAPATTEAAVGGPVETLKTLLDPANTTAAFKAALPSEKSVKRSLFQTQVAQELMRQKVGIKEHKPVLDLVKDDDRLIELAAEVGFMVDLDAGTVTFP